jgi:hypothetical protein
MKRIPFSGRAAIVCALILAVGIPTTAMGFGEGRNLLLGKRNPSSNSSLGLTRETGIIANNSGYGTRQSNKGTGGGAIYGCRSTGNGPTCLRASNINGGQAFSFATTGATAGSITVGNTTGAPFTTNAKGVATGLNADQVDGKNASDFAAASDVSSLSASLLDAQVSATGTLSANSRGAVSASVTGSTYTVKFNRDVSKCSYTASPVGSAAAEAPGVAAGTDATTVTVNTGAAPGGFHLQVIC